MFRGNARTSGRTKARPQADAPEAAIRLVRFRENLSVKWTSARERLVHHVTEDVVFGGAELFETDICWSGAKWRHGGTRNAAAEEAGGRGGGNGAATRQTREGRAGGAATKPQK
jgi:hypothetical protein